METPDSESSEDPVGDFLPMSSPVEEANSISELSFPEQEAPFTQSPSCLSPVKSTGEEDSMVPDSLDPRVSWFVPDSEDQTSPDIEWSDPYLRRWRKTSTIGGDVYFQPLSKEERERAFNYWCISLMFLTIRSIPEFEERRSTFNLKDPNSKPRLRWTADTQGGSEDCEGYPVDNSGRS